MVPAVTSRAMVPAVTSRAMVPAVTSRALVPASTAIEPYQGHRADPKASRALVPVELALVEYQNATEADRLHIEKMKYKQALDLLDSGNGRDALLIGKTLVKDAPQRFLGFQILGGAYFMMNDLTSALPAYLKMRDLAGPGTTQYTQGGPEIWAEATFQIYACCNQKACKADKPPWIVERKQLRLLADQMVEMVPDFREGDPARHRALALRARILYNNGAPEVLADCQQAALDFRRASETENIPQRLKEMYQEQAGIAERRYRDIDEETDFARSGAVAATNYRSKFVATSTDQRVRESNLAAAARAAEVAAKAAVHVVEHVTVEAEARAKAPPQPIALADDLD